MKIRKLILTAIVSLMAGTQAFAATNIYGWVSADNATLYSNFKTYMKTLQVDIVGEPLYFMVQELMVECEVTYNNGEPYAWLGQVSRFCNMVEDIYGPAMSHPRTLQADKYAKIRKAILMLRDYPMHEVSCDDEVAYTTEQQDAFLTQNTEWLCNKRELLFQALDGPRPTGDELQIFKVYSSGVILRTKNSCIGIDICYSQAFGNTTGVDNLASMLDVLYVTHAHGDHYDETLIKAMLNKGKPVVMPSNLSGMTSSNAIIWNSTHADHTLIGGVAETAAVMSAQDTEPCLMFHIELDGWRIIHVGDNSVHDNEPALAKMDQADVVFSPVFQGLTTLFGNLAGASNPDNAQQFYLNIHENEFHHAVYRRVSYKYLYTNTNALGSTTAAYPCTLLLDNGENITLSK